MYKRNTDVFSGDNPLDSLATTCKLYSSAVVLKWASLVDEQGVHKYLLSINPQSIFF